MKEEFKTIRYNWKTDDRMNMRFSLNMMPKRTKTG